MKHVAPNLTEEQRQSALVKALENRTKRAKLREDIASGKVSLEEVFAMEDEIAKRLPTNQLLTCFPGIGDAKAEKIMKECSIAPSRRVGGLGKRQRAKLIEILGQ